ncbi:tetratricopeptide repeat protein [Paraburkholderia sp.]|uniref:tetratricopeptide repeat-containing glycosyltransferase family protein n=1 Tax=Paraburkholderia sp. TaxID=1926495 RepID=UPI003D6EE2D5
MSTVDERAGWRAAAPQASAAQAIARAKALHDQGRLDDARKLYDVILATAPDNAETLHLYGVLEFQTGRVREAEALMRRSIAIEPMPMPLANLGSVLAAAGQREAALVQFDAALALDPVHLHALIRRGNTLVELERHEDAVKTFDRALAVAPTLLDALCNRGAALRGLGRFQEAIESYDRALTIDPRSFESYVNRGNALRELTRSDEALASYDRALKLASGHAPVLSLRGITLVDLERFQEALASFNEAIASQPDFVEAIYNSAVALERLERMDEAIARCDRAISLEPGHAKAHATRANALAHLERRPEALASYDRAIELEPHAADVLCNRGSLLRHLQRHNDALDAYEAALALQPDFPQAHLNRSNVLQDLNRFDEALSESDAILAADPRYAMAWFNRGNLLQEMNRPVDSIAAYERAIDVDPEYVDPHCALGFLLLALGRFPEGWRKYEWRWRDHKVFANQRPFPQPLWLGDEPVTGRTVLLHAEQGFGDTLQFSRYAALVKQLGARVVLEVQPGLTTLMQTLPGVDQLVTKGETLPPFDLHCPLMSLPLALRTEVDTVPATAPYLSADPQRVAQWRDTLGEARRPRVGLSWAGNPKHVNDRNRSIALAALAPLFDLDIEWISLQKQVPVDDEAILATLPLRQVDTGLREFADTAALIETLDLVVSVDTSIAHLAGALGKPSWVLLPMPCDWRWLAERSDSPWYPHTRLFRQRTPKDWSQALGELVPALRDWSAAR